MASGDEHGAGDAAGGGAGGRPSAGLGRRVGGGMAWMLLATGIAKGSSLAAQVVLGLVLAESDFGVYAASIGLAAYVQAFRDGGVRQILIQKGGGHWRGLSGSAFWIATLVNVVMGSVLALGALAIWAAPIGGETAYADPRLPQVLLVLGAALAIASPVLIFQARLSIDLRFRAIARMNTHQALVRNGSMIGLALLGFGPLSFALPILIATVYVNCYGFALTRERLWARPARLRLWKPMLSRAKWLVLLAVSLAALLQGDYLVLGVLLPTEVVGAYFFAYQITSQIQMLLGVNLQMVLFPSLSKLAAEPTRFRAAVLRSTRVLSLFASGAGVGLALVYGPLAVLIWGEKWVVTIPAVQLMALAFPFRMLSNVMNASLMARGRYRDLASLTLLSGLGLMAAAGAAGVSTEVVWKLAAVTAVFFAVWITGAVAVGLSRVGVSKRSFLRSVLPAWSVAVACGGAAWGVLELASPRGELWRLIVGGGAFALLYAAAARVLFADVLRETLAVLPAKVSGRVARVLRLRAAGSERGSAARGPGGAE